MNGTIRLARAELRKLFTTRALPVSFAIAIVLAIGSVIVDAMVAGKNGAPLLGTDAEIYQMLKFGAITCVVLLILGILAAGGEFRHRTIVPVLLATPHRAPVFAVKVAVIAVLGAAFSAVIFGLGLATVVLELSAHGMRHLPGRSHRPLRRHGDLLGLLRDDRCRPRRTDQEHDRRHRRGDRLDPVHRAGHPGRHRAGHREVAAHEAAIGLTNAPGPDPGRALSPTAAGLVLTGYAIALLVAASRTTMRRDVT